MTDLGPWQQIEMSGGFDDVIDLSAGTWDDSDMNGAGMGGDHLARLFALSEAEFDALIEAMGGQAGAAGELSDDLAELLAMAEAPPPGGLNGYALANEHGDAMEFASHRPAPRIMNLAQRSLARELATDAIRRDDWQTAGAIHVELANSARDGLPVELANDYRDLSGRWGHLCSEPDEFGRCSGRYHDADCSAAVLSGAATGTGDDVMAWREMLQGRAGGQVISGGQTWQGSDGRAWTIRDEIGRSAGERLSRPVLGDHRSPVAEPRRQLVTGEPGDPGDPDGVRTPVYADPGLRARLGLAAVSADEIRARATDRQVDAIASAAMRGQVSLSNLAGSGLEGPQRVRTPVQLVPYGDGHLGSLVGLTAR